MKGIRLAGVAIALAATAVESSAQGPLNVLKPRLGLVAGVSMATISGDDISGASNKTGFNGGAYLAIPVSPGFDIQPEVLFSMKGTKASGGSSGSINLKYVEVPVLARINFPTPGVVRPNIFFGPSVAMKAGCSISGASGGVSGSVDCDGLLDIKKVDFGAVAGAGVTFGLGSKRLAVSAQYDLGFKNIADGGDAKNRAFSFLAGLEIPLGM